MSLMVSLKQKEEKLFADDWSVWNCPLATCPVSTGLSYLNHPNSILRLLKKKKDT